MKLTYMVVEGFEDFNDTNKAVLIPTKILRNKSLYQRDPEINVRQRVGGRTGSRTEKQLDRSKRKIAKGGIQHPLGLKVWDNGKIEIIDGTHRLLIASELKIPFVPVRFVPSTIDKPELIKHFLDKHNIKPKFVSVNHTFIDREREVLNRLRRRRMNTGKPQEKQNGYLSYDIFKIIDDLDKEK